MLLKPVSFMKKAAAGGGGFVPGDDVNLVAHWDASDTSSITDTAGDVTAWADQVASATFGVTGTPRTGDTTRNSLNVIDFDGSEEMALAATLAGGADIAFHMVVNVGAVTSSSDSIFSCDYASGGDLRDFQIDAGSASAFAGNVNDNGFTSGSTAGSGPYSGWHIFSFVMDDTAGTVKTFWDNVEDVSATKVDNLATNFNLALMANRNNNDFLAGSVAEFIFTRSVDNRSDYQTYLANKWGF